jgi:hypothetical protein
MVMKIRFWRMAVCLFALLFSITFIGCPEPDAGNNNNNGTNTLPGNSKTPGIFETAP